jgi:hypothetical protein
MRSNDKIKKKVRQDERRHDTRQDKIKQGKTNHKTTIQSSTIQNNETIRQGYNERNKTRQRLHLGYGNHQKDITQGRMTPKKIRAKAISPVKKKRSQALNVIRSKCIKSSAQSTLLG